MNLIPCCYVTSPSFHASAQLPRSSALCYWSSSLCNQIEIVILPQWCRSSAAYVTCLRSPVTFCNNVGVYDVTMFFQVLTHTTVDPLTTQVRFLDIDVIDDVTNGCSDSSSRRSRRLSRMSSHNVVIVDCLVFLRIISNFSFLAGSNTEASISDETIGGR